MVDNINELLKLSILRVKQYPRVFKYLTYDSGIKMLECNNLQFTRANQLNDKEDCHISKINFDFVRAIENVLKLDQNELVSKVKNKDAKPIISFGICSFGTSADNDILWRRYTKTNEVYDGICIELDREEIFKCLIERKIKFVSFVVDYIDKTVESIPYEYRIGDNEGIKLMFLSRLFATKTKAEWADEEELRIILTDEFSEVCRREELYKSCFKRVYLGNEMTTKQRNDILRIVEDAKYKMDICNYNKTPIY
ncbi:MAG: hypothetical protein WC679_09070 [Bacteroidales bacterium]|jgi:hypothetical protein